MKGIIQQNSEYPKWFLGYSFRLNNKSHVINSTVLLKCMLFLIKIYYFTLKVRKLISLINDWENEIQIIAIFHFSYTQYFIQLRILWLAFTLI